MKFFKGCLSAICLMLWLIIWALITDYAGWYGALLYFFGTMVYAGFCLLMEYQEPEEEDDGDTF